VFLIWEWRNENRGENKSSPKPRIKKGIWREELLESAENTEIPGTGLRRLGNAPLQARIE